jgi:hypothetical protein
MSAHRTAVRRGRAEHDGVIVMGADPGIPRVLTGLAGITRLSRCARGVPVLPAFAADTGVQVGQPGVGREANALGEKPRIGQMTRFAKRPFNGATARRHCQSPVLGVRSIYGGRISG